MRSISFTTGIVIVNYYKSGRVVQGVKSIIQRNTGQFEVVIIDNSCDAEERRNLDDLSNFQNVKIVYSKKNCGYAAGVNRGFSYLPDVKYLCLSSPDIILENDFVLDTCIAKMEENSLIGVLAPAQVNDDGSVPEVGRRFPSPITQLSRRLNSRNSELDIMDRLSKRLDGVMEVDWVQSSFCIIRSDLFRKIGGLNERYFLFMADIELCLNTWREGMRVVLFSTNGVRADGVRASGGGIISIFTRKSTRIHIRDAILFYVQNGWRPKPNIRRTGGADA